MGDVVILVNATLVVSILHTRSTGNGPKSVDISKGTEEHTSSSQGHHPGSCSPVRKGHELGLGGIRKLNVGLFLRTLAYRRHDVIQALCMIVLLIPIFCRKSGIYTKPTYPWDARPR